MFIESDIVMITFIFLQQYLRNIVEGTVPSDNMNALMQGRARGVQRLKDGAMGRAIFQYSDEEVIIIIIIITNVDDFFLMLIQQIELLELLKSIYSDI